DDGAHVAEAPGGAAGGAPVVVLGGAAITGIDHGAVVAVDRAADQAARVAVVAGRLEQPARPLRGVGAAGLVDVPVADRGFAGDGGVFGAGAAALPGAVQVVPAARRLAADHAAARASARRPHRRPGRKLCRGGVGAGIGGFPAPAVGADAVAA